MARVSTIKELAEKGLSLRKVAKIAGVSASAVDRTLHGERCCSEKTRARILRVIERAPLLKKAA